jgi:hypothetical protein
VQPWQVLFTCSEPQGISQFIKQSGDRIQGFVYYSKVQYRSCGKMLKQVFNLKEEIQTF